MNRGFTLIELMVVLVIMGVMAAVIIPEMKGTYEDALLRSSGRELINVFTLAYSRAVTLNQTHRVRLDTGSGRYFVESPARPGETLNGFIPVRDVAGAQGEIDRRISVELRRPLEGGSDDLGQETGIDGYSSQEMPEGISFYADGTADGWDVWLQDRAGFKLALRINPVTARVHILENEQARQASEQGLAP